MHRHPPKRVHDLHGTMCTSTCRGVLLHGLGCGIFEVRRQVLQVSSRRRPGVIEMAEHVRES